MIVYYNNRDANYTNALHYDNMIALMNLTDIHKIKSNNIKRIHKRVKLNYNKMSREKIVHLNSRSRIFNWTENKGTVAMYG